MLSFEESDDLSWAKELLSTSSLGAQAFGDPLLEPLFTSAFPEADWDPAFAVPPSLRSGLAERTRQQNPCCSVRPFSWLAPTGRPGKQSGKPGPTKMGELPHSVIVKQLANHQQVDLRSKTLRVRQWGISLPGACEALCHWRGTTEATVANGSLEPLVVADLDLVNMFGNAEWPRIRQVLRTHFPEASAWTDWQHQSDSITSLSTEATFATNRGAEQGDVLAPSRARWSWATRETPTRGQVFLRPSSFDKWLRALAWQCQELCPASLPAWAHVGVSGVGHPVRSRDHHLSQPGLWCHCAGVCFRLSRANQRVPGNRCAPVAKWARRSLAMTTFPRRWWSPGSVLTCPSSCATRSARFL